MASRRTRWFPQSICNACGHEKHISPITSPYQHHYATSIPFILPLTTCFYSVNIVVNLITIIVFVNIIIVLFANTYFVFFFYIIVLFFVNIKIIIYKIRSIIIIKINMNIIVLRFASAVDGCSTRQNHTVAWTRRWRLGSSYSRSMPYASWEW